jgi:hypothetical protein
VWCRRERSLNRSGPTSGAATAAGRAPAAEYYELRREAPLAGSPLAPRLRRGGVPGVQHTHRLSRSPHRRSPSLRRGPPHRACRQPAKTAPLQPRVRPFASPSAPSRSASFTPAVPLNRPFNATPWSQIRAATDYWGLRPQGAVRSGALEWWNHGNRPPSGCARLPRTGTWTSSASCSRRRRRCRLCVCLSLSLCLSALFCHFPLPLAQIIVHECVHARESE